MPKFVNVAGQRFGRLRALSVRREGRGGRSVVLWRCQCDCGVSVDVISQSLRSGATQSCGCMRAETVSARQRKHGMSSSGTYATWSSMIQRCANPNKKEYGRYGGRGIKVCERWKTFELFVADMGKRPAGLTIDRIDSNGDYEPGNCRWATYKQQANNTARNRRYTFKGKTLTMREWARTLGITDSSLSERLDKWPVEIALGLPAARSRTRGVGGRFMAESGASPSPNE